MFDRVSCDLLNASVTSSPNASSFCDLLKCHIVGAVVDDVGLAEVFSGSSDSGLSRNWVRPAAKVASILRDVT